MKQKKFAIKSFKLTVSQLRNMCDFFNIDRSSDTGKGLSKDDLVDRLCDFLENPSEELANKKSPPKEKKAAGVKRKKSSTSALEKKAPAKPADPFALVRKHKKGAKPTDDTLRQWVKSYIVCFDMDTVTAKDAVKTASARFGVDMVKSKSRIKELLAEEM